MATHTSKRVGVLGGLGVGLAGLALIVGVGFSAPPTSEPDLTAELPTTRPDQPNARWIDTVEVPGKVLYRFDTVIFNKGGALDVSRTSAGGPTCQTIWQGGVPTNALTDPGPCTKDLLANKIAYSPVKGHHHFHTQLAAAYELDTTGGNLVSKAAKNTAGFCLYDSWTNAPEGFFADGTICHPEAPTYDGPVREGISNDMGDFYGSQLGDQWVDVTGVVPGQYVLRAEANPARVYTESHYDNNVATDTVTIPGAIAATPPPASTPAGAPVDVALSGSVIGPGELSRKPDCTDGETGLVGCMAVAEAGKLSFQLSSAPAVGRVDIVDTASDLSAVARYTPPAGFNGVATFAYTATDSRGLTSRPATVTVTVGTGVTAGTGGGTGGGGTGGGTTGGATKLTVKLKPSFRLLHSGSGTFLAVKGALPRSQAGRLVRVQRKLGRKVTTIGLVRVAKTGRFSRSIRVHAGTLSVRAALGSNASTKAATSAFRRVTG